MRRVGRGAMLVADGERTVDGHGPVGHEPATVPRGAGVGAAVVVGRTALAVVAGFVGAFGFGMAALAGCCSPDPSGWPIFVAWVGLSWGLALWSVVIVTRPRWLPLFLLAGIAVAALQLLG